MKALWLPYVVADIDAASAFYTGRLGLSEVDSWQHPTERGSVLRAAQGAFIELVQPGRPGQGPGPPPVAFEVDGVRAVNGYAERLDATPHRYPRGHYGFEVPGPAGAVIMIWSER